MFTDSQRELFNKILDVNWGVNHAKEEGKYQIALKLSVELSELKARLRESMGAEAYDTFMSNGKKMFAPKN